jgi:uncharacterized protein YbbC (DUF1343 family)
MFSFRTSDIFKQEDIILHKGRIMVICNQSSWNPVERKYVFEGFFERGNLSCVTVPPGEGLADHPLSAQIPFNAISKTENGAHKFAADDFASTDAIVIELQDGGCRYFQSPNLVFDLFSFLTESDATLPVYIVDRPNPAGRQVEGTALRAGYRSPIGIEGIPHRYGLTIGELSYWIYGRLGSKFPLHIISCNASPVGKLVMGWTIPLSEDFGGFFTESFCSGQYLWKGTNVTPGIGTTRPYEFFGAPFLEGVSLEDNPLFHDSGVFARWASFTPLGGRYSHERCFGYQLLLTPENQYNSLAHSLRLIRCVKDVCPSFRFLDKSPGDDNSLIEMLIGDKELLDFAQGATNWEETKEHIKLEEQKWIKKTRKDLLYPDEPLFRIK